MAIHARMNLINQTETIKEEKQMDTRNLVRMIGYIVCASLAIALAGGIGILKSVQLSQSPAPTGLADTVVPLAAPPYDASKPTVVIVLGNSLTEATDFLGPYAMFAASGAYNVYAVAASN